MNLECAAPAVVYKLGINGLRVLLRQDGDRLEKLLRARMAVEGVAAGAVTGQALSLTREDRLTEEGARMSWDLLSDREREGFLAVAAKIDPSGRKAVERALDPEREWLEP